MDIISKSSPPLQKPILRIDDEFYSIHRVKETLF